VGILQGRKGLILGVANEKSIAWGVARACHREGAELGFNYLGEALKKRVHPLAESIRSSFVEPLDVADDAQIDDFFSKAEARWGRLDFIVHSIAFANRESLIGHFRIPRAPISISRWTFPHTPSSPAPGGRPG